MSMLKNKQTKKIVWLNHDRARTSTLILHFINETPLPWDPFIIVIIAGE